MYFSLYSPLWNRNSEENQGKRKENYNFLGSWLLWTSALLVLWIYCTLASAEDACRQMGQAKTQKHSDQLKITQKHLWRENKIYQWYYLPTVEKHFQCFSLGSISQREIISCIIIISPHKTSGCIYAVQKCKKYEASVCLYIYNGNQMLIHCAKFKLFSFRLT